MTKQKQHISPEQLNSHESLDAPAGEGENIHKIKCECIQCQIDKPNTEKW